MRLNPPYLRALGRGVTRSLNGSIPIRTRQPVLRPEAVFTRGYVPRHPVPQSADAQPTDNVLDNTAYYMYRNGERLAFEAGGQEEPQFLDALLLRDACPQSRSPSSGNKSFATSEIPSNIAIESLRHLPDGSLEITWKNDIPRFAANNHRSVFTRDQLHTIRSRGPWLGSAKEVRPHGSIGFLFWDLSTLRKRGIQRIKYDDWIAGGEAFHRAVGELRLTGLVFVEEVPQSKHSVVELGLKFGALQETFYGRTWDVQSKPHADNIAYTSEYLGLHSDMLYLRDPPKLQLLHCLENDATGGESLFSDGKGAAWKMRRYYPDDFETLKRTEIRYDYDANGFFYQKGRPVIEMSKSGRIKDVWWSPPFQAPLGNPDIYGPRPWLRRWHSAAARFHSIIDDPANVYRHRLRPGECAVFDNRRIFHGREQFDPASGSRHLHGAYVHSDEWLSTARRVPSHIVQELNDLSTRLRSSTEKP